MAQAPAYDKPQADKKIAENTVIVTGCVADKNAGGQYLLTNAVKSSATATTATTTPPATTAPPATTPPPATTAPPSAATTGTTGTSVGPAMSYELWGGENLQAHLGHKVEITGTVDKADADKIGKTEEKKPEMAMSDKDVKAPKLKVTSVKMIAAVCP